MCDVCVCVILYFFKCDHHHHHHHHHHQVGIAAVDAAWEREIRRPKGLGSTAILRVQRYVLCYVLCVMCYVLCVMCYMICVMCYVLCVMCYVLCVMCVCTIMCVC